MRSLYRRGVAIRFPAEKPGNLALLRANSYALSRVRLKYCFLSCPTAGEADCHVASLLAMTCRNLPPVRTIPGHCRCTAGKRPYNRRRVAVFSMSLRTSAWGPRKGAPFAGRGAPRERCPALAFGRSWAWRTMGRRGVAIRFPAEKPGKLALLRANSYTLFRVRLKYCFLSCPAAGERIATSLRSSQ